MKRLTIAVPDDLAEKIKSEANGNVSGWIADLIRDALLRRETAAVAAFEAQHADPGWEAERFAA